MGREDVLVRAWRCAPFVVGMESLRVLFGHHLLGDSIQ